MNLGSCSLSFSLFLCFAKFGSVLRSFIIDEDGLSVTLPRQIKEQRLLRNIALRIINPRHTRAALELLAGTSEAGDVTGALALFIASTEFFLPSLPNRTFPLFFFSQRMAQLTCIDPPSSIVQSDDLSLVNKK